jgi:hypothetical protein
MEARTELEAIEEVRIQPAVRDKLLATKIPEKSK